MELELGYNLLILVIVYFLAELAKATIAKEDKQKALLPYAGLIVGAIIGYIISIVDPDFLGTGDNTLAAILVGAGSGLLATGANQLFKQGNKILKGDFKGLDSGLDEVINAAEETVKESKEETNEANTASLLDLPTEETEDSSEDNDDYNPSDKPN